MSHREQAAVRKVGLLLLFRALVVAGGVSSAALLPRIMGPSDFGRYALLTSLAHWFTFFGGLGIAQVASRQIPALLHAGDREGFKTMVGALLGMRAATGALAALVFLALALSWLRDMNPWVVGMLGLALLLRSPTGVSLAVFLGQGRITRWALADVFRQWGTVVFTVPGFLFLGFAGAGVGYLASELSVLALALFGLRGHVSLTSIGSTWRGALPHLRLGLMLYAGEIILSATERSGEVLLRAMTGDYAIVGHFGVSNTIYFNAVLALQQVSTAFVPMFIALRAQGDLTELSRWIERLLKWLGLGAGIVLIGCAHLAGPLVQLLLGADYRGVELNLLVLCFTLVVHSLCLVGAAQALVFDRPTILVVAGLIRLAVFWLVGVGLSLRFGSLGVCIAMAMGIAAQSIFYVLQSRKVIRIPLKRFVFQILILAPFVGLAWLPGAGAWKLVICLGALAGYFGMLIMFRIITTRELRTFREVLGNRRGGEQSEY